MILLTQSTNQRVIGHSIGRTIPRNHVVENFNGLINLTQFTQPRDQRVVRIHIQVKPLLKHKIHHLQTLLDVPGPTQPTHQSIERNLIGEKTFFVVNETQRFLNSPLFAKPVHQNVHRNTRQRAPRLHHKFLNPQRAFHVTLLDETLHQRGERFLVGPEPVTRHVLEHQNRGPELVGLAQGPNQDVEGGHVRRDAVTDHLGVQRLHELELVAPHEEVQRDVVETGVGFQREVAFHELDDAVYFVVELEAGVGFDEDEEGGLVDGAARGLHLVEEGQHGVEGTDSTQLAEEFVEDGGVGRVIGLGGGPLEDAERGGLVGLAAEEVEELGGGEIRREGVLGCGSGS
ncbi:hypothetical protein E2542_SST24347 [Spatholobus suberectus]|nr:hypothetical protein E2542_SST24347 [Spatholobus suberectus]